MEELTGSSRGSDEIFVRQNECVRMNTVQFEMKRCIDWLARARTGLAEAQEPYLHGDYGQSRRMNILHAEVQDDLPGFPMNDVGRLCARAR